MRTSLYAAAVVLAGLLGTGAPVAAQDGVDTDIGGVWVFEAPGSRGLFVMNLGTPIAGVFSVRGLGFVKAFKSYVAVSNDAPVTLAFQSNGQIRGTVPLEDLALTTSVGSMEVIGGGLNPTNDSAFLRTNVTIGSVTRRVLLRGVRRVTPEVALAGGSYDGLVGGSGISSRKLDLRLTDSDRGVTLGLAGAEGKGHPCYDLTALGPVSVSRAEVPGFGIFGLVLSNNADGFCGRVTTTQYGAATISGKFTYDDKVVVDRPVLNAVVVPDSGKRFRVRAALQPLVASGT
ncbi:MAG: hypothetical protein K8T90_17355 [Planctomycetes bacterium]|nr:hypothetical protein [Planctomycetota bacterium]